jgi:hypothetical protein
MLETSVSGRQPPRRCGVTTSYSRRVTAEGIEDFAMWLTVIVHQLDMLGDPEPTDKVVLKYLRIARSWYKQFILSIETLLNVSTLSIEEVTGRLKAAEDDAVDRGRMA